MKKLILLFLINFLNLQCAKIIFDLDNVLLSHISITSLPIIFFRVGFWNSMHYVVQNGIRMPNKKIFEFADLVIGLEDSERLWFEEKVSGEYLYMQLKIAIKDKKYYSFFNNVSERTIIEGGLTFLLPKRLAQIVNIYPGSIKLINRCLKNNHEIYILSNWDNKSFTLVKKKCCKLFDLFPDENIYTSGTTGMCKPHKNIYQCVIKDNDPSEYYFIDDSDENLKTAKELGINTIKHSNLEATTLKLIQAGLLRPQ